MCKFFFTAFVFLGICQQLYAQTVSGSIRSATDSIALPFSSILIKGTTIGVSANKNGAYEIALHPGEYTLIAQFVGYASVEKKIMVGSKSIIQHFELVPINYQLKEVAVKSGAEDPAYPIIKKAIKNRPVYLNEIKKFSCFVYIKGQLQLRNYPTKFMGSNVDFEDGDTAKRKMIFLSESIANYSAEYPNNKKVEIVATKVSGNSNGFGLGNPQIISFYENIISLGRGLNPRGFISPIANNALNYYKYKFEGTYYEFGKEISRIKVIPLRAYEPLFSGYINIIENEWRIQSVDLSIYKKQQMQSLDTLVIQQNYIPYGKYWVIKNQHIFPAGKFLGFDFFGSFLQVYDQFDLEPSFTKKHFGNTILKYIDGSNKKTSGFWDTIRPLTLLTEEKLDYHKKDSLELVRKDPHYLDSIDHKNNKFSLSKGLLWGYSISHQSSKSSLSFNPLIRAINYNTVEGGVLNLVPSFSKTYENRNYLSIISTLRYGFANKHFNPGLSVNFNYGSKYANKISISGGKQIFTFNNQPLNEQQAALNTNYSLLTEQNFLKIYEASYFKFFYNKAMNNGLELNIGFQFQNRIPLNNLSDMVSWKDVKDRSFTPNYPVETPSAPMVNHQASIISFGINWQPGTKYIELAERKIKVGSKFPLFSATINKGINGLLSSDIDYTRWNCMMSDNLNAKLMGRLSYNIGVGGFLNADKTFLPDWQHFNGNQTIFTSTVMQSFQLAKYYEFANTASFHTVAHVEYHLNGFLTNKIPVLKKLNWFLVTGTNLLYANNGTNYAEYFLGLENIFKLLRVDVVQGKNNSSESRSGVRILMPLTR